jgi:hypothetical protein
MYTIGHSTRSAQAVIALLCEAGVDLLVDVRTVPRSRFNPQFNADVFPKTLEAAGIGYRHFAALGGLRHRPKGAPPSPNGLWQSEAFQAYADYALTPPFHAALAELRGLAQEHRPAIKVRRGGVVAVPSPHRHRLPARRGRRGPAHHGAEQDRAGIAHPRRRAASGRHDRLPAGARVAYLNQFLV